jgi:hypothetical protein
VTLPSVVALAFLIALSVPAAARAEYAVGADPVSATDTELGDRDSTSPAISRDGRYVVFDTASQALLGPPLDPEAAGTRGLVRKDLLTGAVEPVAPPGALGPTSVSANGRYVLFRTLLPLVAGDGNTRSDVYLRDMTRSLSDVDAYELVSSLDGPERAPVYPDADTGSRPGGQGFGLSADGRTAVFWTDGPSNLPAGAVTPAPRAQVLVRSLDRDETRLVTRDKDHAGLPGTPVPPAGEFAATATPSPAISGDGTTVVWQDANPARQVPMLPGEPAPDAAFLWRNVAGGPGVATRRVAGIADPDDPACTATAPYLESDTATGPCYGPFTSSEAEDSAGNQPSNEALSISDDGRRVAFLSSARRRPFDTRFARRGAYVVDMSSGLSRKRATREPVSLPKAISDVRPIDEAVLSGDGRHLVFNSRSNAFDGPRPIGTFQTGELTATNVFVLDLGSNTLERATRGVGGGDYLGALLDPEIGLTDDTLVQQLAVSRDGFAIAFRAADGNLFVGDANGVTDIQVVRRIPSSTGVTIEGSVPPLPVAPEPRVASLPPVHPVVGYVDLGRGGVASLSVRLPAAGTLSAQARARASGRRLTVGKAGRRVSRAATVKLRLRPSRAALRALHRGARLKVVLSIRYKPRSGAGTRVSRRYTLTRRAVR